MPIESHSLLHTSYKGKEHELELPEQFVFDRLPDEIIIAILLELMPNELAHFIARPPSRRLFEIARDNRLWRVKIALYFGLSQASLSVLSLPGSAVNTFYQLMSRASWRHKSELIFMVREGKINQFKLSRNRKAKYSTCDSIDTLKIHFSDSKTKPFLGVLFDELIEDKTFYRETDDPNRKRLSLFKEKNGKTIIEYALDCLQPLEKYQLIEERAQPRALRVKEVKTRIISLIHNIANQGSFETLMWLTEDMSIELKRAIYKKRDLIGENTLCKAARSGSLMIAYEVLQTFYAHNDEESDCLSDIFSIERNVPDMALLVALENRHSEVAKMLLAHNVIVRTHLKEDHLILLHQAIAFTDPDVMLLIIGKIVPKIFKQGYEPSSSEIHLMLEALSFAVSNRRE